MVFESLCTADALEAPSWMRGIAPTNPPTLRQRSTHGGGR